MIIKTLWQNTVLYLLTLLCFAAAAEPDIIHLQKGEQHLDLFGTIHITKPEFLPLSNHVKQRLSAADALVVELDLTHQETLKETAQYMASLSVAPGQRTQDILDSEQLATFKATYGIMAETMQSMRPWVIGVTTIMMRAKQLGFSDEAIDMVLIKLAKNKHIPVIALETVAEQFDVFDQLSPEEEKSFLISSFSDDLSQELAQTVAVWENNDIQAAQSLLDKSARETPELHQSIFIQRNRLMAERINRLNQDKPHLFIAVGALHLYGKESIITELNQRGYHRVN